MRDQHRAVEGLCALFCMQPVSSIFVEDLSGRARIETTAGTLSSDWACLERRWRDYLAAMQARHWCGTVIGLMGWSFL